MENLPPDTTTDWSEFPQYLGSPPCSPIHGFEEGDIPERLIIETEVVDGEDVFKGIRRKKRTGRPKGETKLPEVSPPVSLKRNREDSLPADPPVWRTSAPSPTIPKTEPRGTGSRPAFYLMGQAPTSMKPSKLPTKGIVLARFLANLENSSVTEAEGITRNEVKQIWVHHFGERLVQGKDIVLGEEDEEKRIVRTDRHIDLLIKGLHKEWNSLEKESRRPARASKPNFKKKEDMFREDMRVPFNIAKARYEEIIKESGIIDWVEECQHLSNQLSVGQPGCIAQADTHQRTTDTRKITDKLSAIGTEIKENEAKSELLARKKAAEEADSDPENIDIDNNNDPEYTVKQPKGKKKIDVMSKISITSDRANVSYQARTMIVASTANALGIDINDTNISKTTAWRKAQEVRIKTSDGIKEKFECPDHCIGHFDGKTLTIKGNEKTNRICVYVTGGGENPIRKLLGVPETPSGTGAAEAKVVTDTLTSWDIHDEVVGIVFDTTSSNTGIDSGACKFIEEWAGSAILWLACRHHIAELHIMRATKAVLGDTTDPGVKLFKRLKKEWSELKIDLDKLRKIDLTALDSKLQEEAAAVLSWAQEELSKGTWPREDYKELLELMIVYLGGTVSGFTFKMPGADHHARWMSKAIYFLKIKLLSDVFDLLPDEKIVVEEVSKFTALLYVKYWLQTPLPSSAARHDLEFLDKVLNYRHTNPSVAYSVIQSVNRHLWYLTSQLIPLALADPGLEDTSKELIAKALHACKQEKISSGKPTFPVLPKPAGEMRNSMEMLVTSDSWLVFKLLGMEGPHDWLQTPAHLWKFFAEFRRFKEFATNLAVCNDIAERGIHLMTDFIKHCESEDQRQALFQCVEYHRELVPNCNKENLKLC